jgi:hypothetical protein
MHASPNTNGQGGGTTAHSQEHGASLQTGTKYQLPPYLSHLRPRLQGVDIKGVEVVATLTPEQLKVGPRYHFDSISSALSFITLTDADPASATCVQIPPGFATDRVVLNPRIGYGGDGRMGFYLLEVELKTGRCISGGRLMLEREDAAHRVTVDDQVNLTSVNRQVYLLSRPFSADSCGRLTFYLANRPEPDRLSAFEYIHTRLYRIFTSAAQAMPEGSLPRPAGQATGAMHKRPVDNSPGLSQQQERGETRISAKGKTVRGGRAFVRITGIIGQSMDKKHRGWHEIRRWTLETQPLCLTLVKDVDRSSAMFRRWHGSHSRISEITLVAEKGGRPMTFRGMKLEQYSVSGAKKETLVFTRISKRKGP